SAIFEPYSITSSRLTICSRRRSGSGDMDQAALDRRPHAWLHGIDREQAHGGPEQALEMELQIHVAIEGRCAREFDEHADVRSLAPFAACGRPKERKCLDGESPLELRDTVTQCAQHLCSVHTRVSPPAGECTPAIRLYEPI